jgi:hypothetical protein
MKRVAYTSAFTWLGLGFKRGLDMYHYEKETCKKPYMYTNLIMTGFKGLIIYTLPPFIPILLYKEFCRLEINIRKLENEKKTSFYRDIL